MSPRAAARLESLGFEHVYDYVAGKADWGSAGLPLEGRNGSETRAGAHLQTEVPTCRREDAAAEAEQSAGDDLRRPARRTTPPRRRGARRRAAQPQRVIHRSSRA